MNQKSPFMKRFLQKRKALYLAITAASQLILTPQVLAGPEGGRVVGGSGSITQSGLNTTIQQQTDRMAIDWQSFNVAGDERVQFIQPSSSSLALNRVLSHTGSEIHGRIEANGHILLVNPNGVFFGESSHINVGGMIASGLSIDPADFMNGEFTLTALEGSEGKVINSGIINAATGGSVSLIGQQVKNEGMISARLGSVNLAAGKEAVVTFDQQGLVGVRITKEILQDELGVDSAVINSGEISAKGGRILLSASTSQDIFSQAVNHGELSSASSVVVHEDGSFTLGAGADVINTGSLDVSSDRGNAGHIVVIGENITHSGLIRANTDEGNAGNIELHSVDTTHLMESANIVAEAEAVGNGGKIKILGNKVGLFDEAQVSASGTHGGGEVLVGGDESGTNTRIRNADFIYLGQDTRVSADGILDGHGGKIITFASDTARIHGELSARGGEFGGSGGFIETSGLKGFELSSTPRISSPMANGGTWLIDPYNISISSNDTNIIPEVDNVFTSSETGSVVYFETLKAVLNSAGNEGVVIVRTGAGGDGEGNISLLSNIEYDITPGGTTTLRLEAHNNIIFGNNSYIRNASDDSGKLNIELIANLDGDISNGGNIIFNQGSYVRTSGGYFSAGIRFDANEQGELIARLEDIATPKGNDFLAYENNNVDFATIDTSTETDSIGGSVIINMGGEISAGSSITTGGGAFTILNSSSFTNNYSNSTISTANSFGGGDITINSTGNVDLGAVNFSYLYTNDAIRSGSVTIEAGGNVYLHEDIDFNDTEIFNDTDPNDGQDSFLAITSAGDINILGSITDSWSIDERDIFDITLDAGGAVDIQGAVATSGGNFTILNSASVTTGDDGGASISTLGTYEDTTTFFGNVTINSTGAVSVGSAIDTAGGSFIVNSSSEFSNNFNDGDALISTGGGVFSVASSGAVSIGSTVATSGGDFIVIESGSFNSNLNDALIETSTSSSAPIGAGGGDIQINSDGNITIGLMDFSYAATTNNNNTVRVGSVTATAGGNITLARTLDYNDTGPRDIDAQGTLPTHGEETFIDFTANGDINIDALVYDRIGDARDLIEVSLAADADNTSTGTLNINADLYTSGGSFSGSGYIFDASGAVVNTNHANNGEGLQEDATWSDGGNITIAATSSISLGELVTDSACLEALACTGNLTLQGRVVGIDSPDVSQTESLSVAGLLTVDVGTGDVTLTNTYNSFTGPLVFNNVGTVDLVNPNTAGTIIGQSSIGGDFTLTSGGEVTQFDDAVSLIVNGQTSLSAANKSINLSNEANDFVGVVNVSSVGSLVLSDGNDLSVGDINTSGDSTRVTGNITLSANGNLDVGAITANGATGNTSNRNGGEVTLSANNNITAASISTLGAGGTNNNGARAGGNGGAVSLTSNSGLIETGTINTSGGDGHLSTGFNNRNGGQAGDIEITALALGQSIKLNGNLIAQGGLAGNSSHQNGASADINLNGSVQLANNLIINAGVKEGAAGNLILGNIIFNEALNSDNSAAWNLNLIANDITFRQDVGLVNRLGVLNINAVNDVNAQSMDAELRSLNANTLIASATGFYAGDINTSAALADTAGGSISITAEDISIGALHSSGNGAANGGSISVTASGDDASIALNGDVNAQAGDDSTQGTVDIALASAGSISLNHTNFFTSTINILGSSGDDTLNSFDIGSTWTITGGNAGNIGDGNIDSISFSGIEHLVGGTEIDLFVIGGGNVKQINGGGSEDSLQADDLQNTWTLNSPTSGTLETPGPGGYLLSFSDVENLRGNNQIDTFIFAMENEYSGVVDAVGDDNIVSIADDINANIEILLGESINGVLNADIVMGNGQGSITVQGDATNIHTWQINDLGQIVTEADGINDGMVSNNGGDSIRFIDFANLIGSTATDNFIISESALITGTINGGSGSAINTLFNNTSNSTWTLTGSRQGNLLNASETIADFTNIHSLAGSGSDTLIGRDQTNDWEVDALNSGFVQINGGSADRVAFSGMQNITGGIGSDYFTFSSNGLIEGNIIGGDGTDTLIARHTTNTWLINGENRGQITDEIVNPLTPYAKFQNVENLIGGNGVDTFSFSNNGSIVDADGGDGIDSISFAGIENVVVTLGAAALNGVRGIEQFIGNGATSTLRTANTSGTNTWTIMDFDTSIGSNPDIDGLDDGEVNLADGSSITFIDFSNLEGGAGTDIFTFDHEDSGTITGSISGGIDGDSTIIARNTTNTWRFSDTGNSLGVTTGTIYLASFSNIQTVQGGNGVDTFTINNAFSGNIYAGGGDDIFAINASAGELFGQDGHDQFNFTSSNNAGRATRIDGGAGQNILNGRNIGTIWQFTDVANYLTSDDNSIYVESFTNIQTLQGGSAVDTFVIDNGFGGDIYGGAGNDIFVINSSSNNLFGEDGNDDFTFTSTNNAGSAVAINGGAGENRLLGRHVATTWNFGDDANSLSISNSNATYVASFSGIQRVQGGSAVDMFNINSSYMETIAGGGGADSFYINALVNNLYGESNNDQFIFSGVDNVGVANVLDGGTGNDTLIGRDIASIWTLGASNTLVAGGNTYVSGIVAIETLQGGSAEDTFHIENNLFSSILGGNNNDIFHINATVDSLFGEAGNDQFIFSSANNAGSAATIDGGSGNDILVGRNTANTWLIDNAGSRLRVTGSGSDYVQSFTDMQVLQGGNTVDTYDLDADFDGDVFAGAGNDIFNINASVNLLSGEDGDDNFLFDSLNNNGIATSILGGNGENSLVGRDVASTWNIAASGHSVGVTNGAIYVASFEDIQILQGGNAIDDFSIDIAFGGTISGGDGDDLFTINAVANTLRGEDGNDQFIFSSISNAGSAELIVGGDGDDTLVGRNVTNNWNLAATGNSLADAANAAYVIAFEDVDILQGGSAVDNFLIDAAFDGEIRGGSGEDLFSINGIVSALLGEAGNDQFVFSSLGNDGSTNSIDGGDGEDRLIARNVDNTWNLSNGNNLGVSDDDTYVASFSNIQILQGGNATDRFFINAAFTGSIYGGEGNDIFTVNAAVNSLAGEGGDDEFSFISAANAGSVASLDGGTGTNLLRGRNEDSIWTLTGDYSGRLAETLNATNYVTLFSSIHNLEGGAAEDTLVGQNQSNQWQIDNIDAGRLGSPGTDVTTHLVFSSMQNIVGGTSQDNFIFTTSASDITGLIDGGISGNNTVEDTLDLSLLGQGVVVELFDSNTDNLHVINMEEIIAPVTTAENNYLYGASDRAYIWTIDGINSGSVARADSPSLDSTTRFDHFGQLRGGENNDRFEVVSGGSIAGTIHGGDGDGIDFADYSHTNAHVTVSLGGDGSLGVTGIDGIEGVVGNNGGSSSAQFNSVIGITSGNNIWTIGSFDSVTDGINDGQIAITLGDGTTKTISFENFNVLSGGSGNDEFNFSRDGNNDGVLLGYINGGTGNNIFNAAISSNNPIASAADQTIQIRNVPQDLTNLDAFTPLHGVTQVFGFTDIIANANTNSTLVSADGANTWDINANGTNRLTTSVADIAFSGFSRLTGGSALDNFYVRSLEGPLRVIDGGSDSSIDTIDFSQLDANTAVVVGVGETALADMNILGIEKVNAHNHANNELVSDAGANTWRITDVDTGSLNTNLMFAGFANLTGTTGNDSFIFVNENASLSGVMDGGAGDGFDTLDLTDVNRDISLRLTGSATADDELRAINLEQIEASNNFVNTLLSGSTDNLWSISGNNTGSLANASGVIEFIGFRNLIGNTGNDQFVFYEQGSLDGYIDGSTQPTPGEDRLDLSRLGSVDVLLAESGLGYRGIERIIGNDQDSTLRGQGANTWNLIGQNSGNINNTIIFEGFTALIGGEGNDQFNLTQGSLAGSVSGGLGNDTFVLGDAAIAGGIYGDGGNDVLEATVTAGTTGAVNFVGGTGNNRLTATGGGAGFTAQHAFTFTQNGQLRYLDNTNSAYTISYSDVTDILDNIIATSLTINTTSEADTIALRNRAYTFNDLTSVAYNNKNNLVIAASAGDQVVVNGTVNIPQLLTIQDAQVSAAAGGSIVAAGLRLDGTAAVGSENNRLNVDINELYIRSTHGDVYLTEQNTLNISEFSANGLIDLVLDGDLTSSIALASAQGFNAASTNGNVILDKENALSGTLNLSAANDINLRNLTATNLADINARQLNINSNGVINSSGFVDVNGLTSLVSGGNINLANREHNFNSVQIGSAAGVSINNMDLLTLIAVDASGTVNINAQGINANGGIAANNLSLNGNQGAVSLSSNIQATGEANIAGQSLSVAGDITASAIQLHAQADALLNGELNTLNGQTISVTANNLMQNGLITAGTDVRITTTEDLTQNADILANNRIVLSAGTDLLMNGSYATQGNIVEVLAGDTLNMNRINAENGISVTGGIITQQHDLLSSNGDIDITASSITMNSGTALTANTGSIQVNTDTDITARSLNAGRDIFLSALGNVQLNDDLIANTGAIDIQGRNINLAGDLMGQTDINIVSAAGSLQQQGLVQSQQGNIAIDVEGDLVMAGNSEARASGDIIYRAADLAITRMETEAGAVTLAAHDGAVTDNNSQTINVTAQRLVVDAEAGIGANDVIETLINELSVSNNQGDIRLENGQEVRVDRLRSNGNIVFSNLAGSVTLDNTNGLLFTRNEPDARLAGGTMNANYDIGTLTINVAQGDLTAVNSPNLDNPDIVARNAALIAPTGNIGSPGRPLVIYVKDSLFIGGLRSWSPLWGFDTAPQFVENTSTIQGNLSDLLASGSEQLVAVETLEEVNPAIFTSVRNYFYDDISILLPRDQLYYDDEYEQ